MVVVVVAVVMTVVEEIEFWVLSSEENNIRRYQQVDQELFELHLNRYHKLSMESIQTEDIIEQIKIEEIKLFRLLNCESTCLVCSVTMFELDAFA